MQILQQCFQAISDVVIGQALQFQYRLNVLCHRQAAKDRCFLRQITQTQARAAVYRQMRDVLVVNENFPAIGSNQSHDHVKRCGLPRAVRAQQADHLAALHRHRSIMHHGS